MSSASRRQATRWGLLRRVTPVVLVFGVLLTAGVSSAVAAPEEPVTEAATGVSGTAATVHGKLNPHALGKAGYFFAYSPAGACSEGFASKQEAEVTGKEIKVSALLKELEGSTEYMFCVVATSVEEVTFGAALSFKTAAEKPLVLAGSDSSSGVTPFAGALHAEVNPENQPSTGCVFEYGKTLVSEHQATCEPESLEGASPVAVSAAASGLSPATKYHYRAVVKNAAGETKGPEATFTTLTLEDPVVDSQSASGLSGEGATFEATLNPNYQETAYQFEYATNEALSGATILPGGGPLPAEFAELPVSVPVTGLAPRTTYYYRVTATNATGTVHGTPVKQFTTQATPLAATGGVEALTRTSAGLTGSVNPAGAATSYHFVYVEVAKYLPGAGECPAGLACAYAHGAATQSASAGAGYSEVPAGPLAVTGLTPGVSYDYAIVAENTLGTIVGANHAFTTLPPTPPLTATGGAEGISQLSATLTGTVDTRGLATSSAFQFGLTPEAASTIPASSIPTTGTQLTLTASLQGTLQPATSYYYRVVATNADGTTYGAWQVLTTPANPNPLPGATLPTTLTYTPITQLDAKEAQELKTQLNKALKHCRLKHNHKQRGRCEKQAQKQY